MTNSAPWNPSFTSSARTSSAAGTRSASSQPHRRATDSTPFLPNWRTSTSSICRATPRIEEPKDCHAHVLGILHLRDALPYQEPLHVCLFRGLAGLLVSLHCLGEFWPGRQQQREGAAQRPLRQLLQRPWL